MDVLRPYFLLACVAFVIGFASYLVAARALTPMDASVDTPPATIQASAPDVPLTQARVT